jgi:hypothetical protein
MSSYGPTQILKDCVDCTPTPTPPPMIIFNNKLGGCWETHQSFDLGLATNFQCCRAFGGKPKPNMTLDLVPLWLFLPWKGKYQQSSWWVVSPKHGSYYTNPSPNSTWSLTPKREEITKDWLKKKPHVNATHFHSLHISNFLVLFMFEWNLE